MKSLTVTALSLIVAALLSIGGLVFALFLFFPLFLLGLTGVLSGLEDRTECEPAHSAASSRMRLRPCTSAATSASGPRWPSFSGLPTDRTVCTWPSAMSSVQT